MTITDVPVNYDGITGVFITVSEIHYHTSENSWKVFTDYAVPKTFNLPDLQRGESGLLGSFELESGTYTQIKFLLDAPIFCMGQHSNPGYYPEFKDESDTSLFVPSGSKTGCKAAGEFTVSINRSVDVTADFDLRKSIIKASTTGIYRMLKDYITSTCFFV